MVPNWNSWNKQMSKYGIQLKILNKQMGGIPPWHCKHVNI
jgi:hypothetical protein